MTDLIDTLVGIAPGSALDAIRAQRPDARTHAQASYDALFAPEDHGGITLAERFAIARFTTGLHQAGVVDEHYAARLAATGPALIAPVAAAVAAGTTNGPYGAYPPGPLAGETTPGLAFTPDPALGPKLAAAFAHVHMLVFHPRDSAAAWLQSLLDAGWSTTDIVTISQIVAFLSFQIRVVTGLRVLAATN